MTQRLKQELLKEIRDLPDHLAWQVLDFVRFIKQQAERERRELLAITETALAKDWLRPEEDEAWRDL